MFVIQWLYTLASMGVAALVYFYIGQASPGLYLGKWLSHCTTISIIFSSFHRRTFKYDIDPIYK
jgi:hypothetical protein